MRTILRTVVGSRAYNLETPASDWDFRSVFILETSSFLKLEEPKLDYGNGENMELLKFCRLASKGSPNQIEYLFSKYAEPQNEGGDLLLKNRDVFISKLMVPRYLGFMDGNLKRYGDRPKTWVMAYRLLTTCRDLLKTGVLNIEVPQIYMGEVEYIRENGVMKPFTYEELREEIRELEKTSPLKDKPDVNLINELMEKVRWTIA